MPAHSHKFSTFDLQHIREALQNNVSQIELARSYGVSQATMSRVINDNDLNISDKPLTPLEQYMTKFFEHLGNPGADVEKNMAKACNCMRLDCERCWATGDDDDGPWHDLCPDVIYLRELKHVVSVRFVTKMLHQRKNLPLRTRVANLAATRG